MTRAQFDVTYEIVTQESASHGDSAERGWILEGASLRDAVAAVHETRTCHVGGVESIATDSAPADRVRWITIDNAMEYLTGEYESRSLHIPASVSRATSRRIARLLGAL